MILSHLWERQCSKARPPTRRRWFGIAIVPLLIALTLGGVALLPLPPRPGITKANFDIIRDGMTFDEVRRILGGPDSFTDPSLEGSARRGELLWINDDRSGAILFLDENGRVSDKTWADSTEGIGDKLCRWMRFP